MKILLVTILSLLLCCEVLPQSKCLCKKTELAAIRGHETIALIEQVQYERIQGVIRDPSKAPLYDAVVEVHAILNVSKKQETNERQKRIEACQIGQDGRFCFSGLKPGRYRLFIGAQGFNSMEIFITLKRGKKSRATQNLEIILPVGI